VIAATNHNLDQLIAKGQFREDLFYRLNVVPIRIPPLCERKEDVPPLVAHYLDLISARYKRNKSLSSEAYGALVHYNWPGNVRELINLIERLIVVVDEPVIELRHLPAEITSMAKPADIRIDAADPSMGHNGNGNGYANGNGNGNGNGHFQGSLKALIEEYEGKIIASTIARCGSLMEASKHLGVDVTTLFRKRKRVLSSADLQNCH
jgi:DNA-binding NtrC family response regulator